MIAKKVSPVPDGFHTITPYMSQKDATKAIEWYKKALGAEVVCVMPGPGGAGVAHAEIKIGDSHLMMSDQCAGQWVKAPAAVNATTVGIHLYVPDCDAVFKRAVDAGAETVMPLMDMFWGDRFGKFKDPFGHEWGVATHKEDVPPDQMAKRAEEAFKHMKK